VRVFADLALQRHDLVWAAGGTPTTVFPIVLSDLVSAAGAEWVDVAE
jgi:prolyl-tRNA editing enzyme YbaK/EbsC (Cys-tRNA(Pro) deacylase)